jgi:hypothetical protein
LVLNVTVQRGHLCIRYAWENVVEEYCLRTSTSFGCLERGRRVTRRGVGRHVVSFLDQVDRDDRAFMLSELGRLLPQTDATERGSLIAPILVAELTRRKAAQQALDEWESTNRNLEHEHSAKKAAHRAQWQALMFGGASAVGSGITAALAVCLVVAALAIEHHLRTLSRAARP